MEEKLICITTVKSRIEAEQMLSFLKENGIYAAIQGGVQELYTGDSVSGDKIMVSAAHKEKAQKLLENFSPDPGRKKKKTQKAVNWILLGIIAAILVFAVILLL